MTMSPPPPHTPHTEDVIDDDDDDLDAYLDGTAPLHLLLSLTLHLKL